MGQSVDIPRRVGTDTAPHLALSRVGHYWTLSPVLTPCSLEEKPEHEAQGGENFYSTSSMLGEVCGNGERLVNAYWISGGKFMR